VANVFEPQWTNRDGPGLAGRLANIGAQASTERLGATLYEIASGAAGSPFHAHYANEELIIVLAGTPMLTRLRWPSHALHRCSGSLARPPARNEHSEQGVALAAAFTKHRPRQRPFGPALCLLLRARRDRKRQRPTRGCWGDEENSSREPASGSMTGCDRPPHGAEVPSRRSATRPADTQRISPAVRPDPPAVRDARVRSRASRS
jgi:hypothetical protein